MICQKLTEAMGGKITVESEHERGSKFTFSIQNNTTSSLTLQTDEEKIQVLSFRESTKVLVVDDEYICALVMKKMIEGIGLQADMVIVICLIIIGSIWRRSNRKSLFSINSRKEIPLRFNIY